ncbi:DUF3429 domain-containing protein [Methylobacterium thuringiense]|uniref:DUF3429 domain-containing protein n=1 Tax=Methylobacterium thuringiense TaxID=1003091 RepID=A0ABQ4TRQ2_9HYPH|nr:DUF3429 domain-containing protein [Methylobacterium thuringiense]GJE57306.1 hypothetical protein EKPJFOCH_3820 [Methylobacterium thuringiense]
MRETATGRTVTAQEPREIPWLSIVFGFGPMMPFVGGAALAWWLRGDAGNAVLIATALWSCAILLFLSGVRRGVSFRTEGGATLAQMMTMLGYFGTGLVALGATYLGWMTTALSVLLAAYITMPVLDAIAARRGEAPLFFARLRPVQIPLAIASLAAMLILALVSGHV